ncbi:MAG: heavy metal-binding domain-containing protein [Brumimicrobium sp.]
MKKVRLLAIGGLLFLGGLTFTSCTNAGASTVQYACPMDCEDGKVYDEAGTCPVCKMDLVDVTTIESME